MTKDNSSKSQGGLTPQQSLDLALDYLALNSGRYLFPIARGKKFPPLIKNNLADASNSEEQIRAWCKRWPGCNWALSHKKSRVLVVDVDTKPGKNGQATFDDLDLDYGFPETEKTRTPSGGFHLVYEGEHIFALGKYGFGEDCDSPNYSLIPGCKFADGTEYVSEGIAPTAKAPQWMYDVLGRAKEKKANANETVVDLDKPENVAWAEAFLREDAEPAIEGKNGDYQTLKIAMGVRDKGISEELCFSLMLEYYNERCEPPWEPDDLQTKVYNAYRYASQSAGGDKTAEAEFKGDDVDVDSLQTFGTPEKIAADKLRRKDNGLVYASANSVEMRAIEWIWDGHLALGHHTSWAGVQGDGKSQLVYMMASIITRGGTFPGSDQRAPLGNVIVLNAEDRDTDTLVPRLAAAGADLEKVFIVQAAKDKGNARKFSLITDLDKLRKMAAEIGDVKLITFDPVSSYLGGDLDSHSNTELRNALDPITAMANDTAAAVLSVTHFNKSASGVSALNRVMGGAGFTAAPRAAAAVIRDAKNPSVRYLLSLKNNLASEGSTYGMSFTIAAKKVGEDPDNGKDIIAPYVVFGEKTTLTADEALAANNKKLKGPTKQEEAETFLIQLLGRGPVPVRDVEAAATKRGITPATLRSAKQGLGVISQKTTQLDGRGPWLMSLPDDFFPEGSARPAPLAGEEPDFDWPDAADDFADDRTLN